MDMLSLEMAAPSVWRRFWPELLLLVGLVLLAAAVGAFEYIDGDLVLIGSLNACVIVGASVIAAIWCVAFFLIFRFWKLISSGGLIADVFGILVGGAIVIAALWVSAMVGIFTLVGSDLGPYRVLDVPGSTTSVVVTTLTLGETSVRIYRGDGIRYERVALTAPTLNRASDPGSIAVDVDASGQPFLFYSVEGGGIAHVLLPLD